MVLGIDQEDTNVLANVFFKHQERALNEFYTMNWCHREAIRLSWKCHQKVGLTAAEKGKAAVAEKIKSNKKPSLIAVKEWFKKQKQLFYAKTGEVYEDRNLEVCLEIEENMQGIEDEMCKWSVIEIMGSEDLFFII